MPSRNRSRSLLAVAALALTVFAQREIKRTALSTTAKRRHHLFSEETASWIHYLRILRLMQKLYSSSESCYLSFWQFCSHIASMNGNR